jgi:hypothetical protein
MAVDRLGWAIEVEDGLGLLVNPAFTPPGVTMSGIDTVSFVRFRIADVVTEETPATRAFLGDLFTSAVREGAARLGRPSIRRDRGRTDTIWEDGARPGHHHAVVVVRGGPIPCPDRGVLPAAS